MPGDEAHRAAIQRAAVVLAELSHEIERLGAELCADPEFVERHITALQAIDLIAQQQHAIAELLQAECPVSGIEQIGVEGLQERLRNSG